jgi:hypothetical protein
MTEHARDCKDCGRVSLVEEGVRAVVKSEHGNYKCGIGIIDCPIPAAFDQGVLSASGNHAPKAGYS